MDLPITVLEDSFDLIAPRGEELVERFYAHFFVRAPEVVPLFAATDMARQRQMLLGALILFRRSLRHLESVVPTFRALGARHATYGVLPEHYPVFGGALLDSMAAIGGSAWVSDYSRAWADAFQLVQDTMLSGANALPRPETAETQER